MQVNDSVETEKPDLDEVQIIQIEESEDVILTEEVFVSVTVAQGIFENNPGASSVVTDQGVLHRDGTLDRPE